MSIRAGISGSKVGSTGIEGDDLPDIFSLVWAAITASRRAAEAPPVATPCVERRAAVPGRVSGRWRSLPWPAIQACVRPESRRTPAPCD
jgi:hypothetical protein